MRVQSIVIGLSLIVVAACSPSDANEPPAIGEWGSNQASLTLSDSASSLFVASGSCYIAFAAISGRIPGGQFTRSGTYTRLIGIPPGFIEYAAQFSGTADLATITITITVPGLGQSIGPLTVAYGVTKNFPPCAVP